MTDWSRTLLRSSGTLSFLSVILLWRTFGK